MQTIDKIEVDSDAPCSSQVLWVDTISEQLKWCGRNGWQDLLGIQNEQDLADIKDKIKDLQGTDLAYKDVMDALRKTVYSNHVYANITVRPTVIYKNEPAQVTITYNGGITGSEEKPEYIIKKQGIVTQIASGDKDTIILDNDVDKMKYSMEVKVGGISKTVGATVSAYWPIYTFGSGEDKITAIPTTAKKEAATDNPIGKTYTFTVKQDEYIYIAVPTGMSINGGTSSNFDVGLKFNTDIQVLQKGLYHVYRTNKRQDAGTYSITMK